MVHTLPDITGTGVAVALSATRLMANWIQFTVPTNAAGSAGTNSAAVRVGDKNTSAARGSTVSIYGLQFSPIGDGQSLDLQGVFAFIANGDKLQVTYGVA